MDGDVQHITAIVEDFLDALSVVHVGIQDHRTREPAFHMLGSDGGIVQVAEAPGGVFAGVVAGWAAYGIGIAFAANQRIRRPECGLGRPVGSLPGILANRATAISQVAGRFRQDTPQGIGGAHEDVGHHLVTPVFHFHPAPVGGFQESQITQVMHLRDRRRALIGGL